MTVAYRLCGANREWSGAGYSVKCVLPTDASDVVVSFGVVGGGPVHAVDRGTPGCPWLCSDSGGRELERFVFPGLVDGLQVSFVLRGPVGGCYVSEVSGLESAKAAPGHGNAEARLEYGNEEDVVL